MFCTVFNLVHFVCIYYLDFFAFFFCLICSFPIIIMFLICLFYVFFWSIFKHFILFVTHFILLASECSSFIFVLISCFSFLIHISPFRICCLIIPYFSFIVFSRKFVLYYFFLLSVFLFLFHALYLTLPLI